MVDDERGDRRSSPPSRPTWCAPRSRCRRSTSRSASGRTRTGCGRPTRIVADFAPGHDAEAAFQGAFKEAGGEIIGSVRYPVGNPDFSAFVQRAKDMNPEAIFIFVPGGAQSPAIGKALADRGIDPQKTKVMAQARADRRASA